MHIYRKFTGSTARRDDMQILQQNNLLILYLCLFFCLCIGLFNCYEIIHRQYRRRSQKKQKEKWKRFFGQQLELYRENEKLREELGRQFRSRLHTSGTLLILEQAWDEMQKEAKSGDGFRSMLELWMHMVLHAYRDSEEIIQAYLIMLLGKYRIRTTQSIRFIFDMQKTENIDIQSEAFYSICRMNDGNYARLSLLRINRLDIEVNQKMITDALMECQDKRGFFAAILPEMKKLKSYIQVGIISALDERADESVVRILKQRMRDAKEDKEVRIAVLKLFARYRDEETLDILLDYAASGEWEYAAIAAKSLAHYPCRRTAEQLKARVSDKNWHVRYNNAMSLVTMAQQEDIEEILCGKDLYARDILQYALNGRKEGAYGMA